MRTILALCFCLLLTVPASAVWVDYFEEEPDQVPLRWYVTPDGSGPSADGARMEGGEPWGRNFRIRPHVDDMPSFPPVEELLPPDFPLEDIWLEGVGLASCPMGTSPDLIDDDGWVIWETPLHAGGSALDGTLEFWITGFEAELPALELVSSDLNGDLVINLSDISPFVEILNSSYDPRADFNWDGIIDLSDVILMIWAIGAECEEAP